AHGTPGMVPGPYRVRGIRFRTRAVATNKCPAGVFRGVGMAPAAFVHERTMDILARHVGLDPVEVRRRNLVRRDELPFTTVTAHAYDRGASLAALEGAAALVGFPAIDGARAEARERGRLLGVGFGSYVEFTGVGSQTFKRRGQRGIMGYDEARIAIEP